MVAQKEKKSLAPYRNILSAVIPIREREYRKQHSTRGSLYIRGT